MDTYAEWDSWETIDALTQALELYNNVILIEGNQEAYIKLKETKPDIVFNVTEGFNGISREAQIPAMLDLLNIPYTGSDPLTLSTCLDKSRTKEILSYHKIPNCKFTTTKYIDQLNLGDLLFPLIVKPVSEGSSKGIYSSSFVSNENELFIEVKRVTENYNQTALIEEYLPGREFTVALLGNDDEIEILPIVELNYKDFPDDLTHIYSYEAKWLIDTKDNPLKAFTCPAKISHSLEQIIRRTALQTFNVLNCKDWGRIDLRLDTDGIPNVIEINPLPGILPDPRENSSFPKAAFTSGLTYNEMINKVLYISAKRHGLV
ncbi:MAG: ATP-grasp domain-containing protein [Bacteroidetes bacterium]|nr:ATP-grasp domain-containing protein [Bacteroidota bacterium]